MGNNTAEKYGVGIAMLVAIAMVFLGLSTITSSTPDASLAPDEIKYHIEVVDTDNGNRHYYTSNYSLTSSILLDDFWEYTPPYFWWQDGTWEHIQATLLAEGGEYIIMEFER